MMIIVLVKKKMVVVKIMRERLSSGKETNPE